MADHWKPNDEQRQILEDLIKEEQASGSAAAFTREYLPFSEGKWSKIKLALEGKHSYFDEITAPEKVMRELAEILEEVILLRARAERDKAVDIVKLVKLRAVAEAVRQCKGKSSPERLVKYLAPTGGGKTILCNWLAREMKAFVVESREAWKRSYYTFLTDICKAVRVRLGGESRPSAIEDELIASLSNRSVVLAIDEGEYFGASAINGIKLLLNKTRVVIVLCSLPDAHDRWNKYFPMEAGQIQRRTHAVIEVGEIDGAKDVALFFPSRQFEDEQAALALIAAQATRFGHYSLVSRVVESLRGKEQAEMTEVQKAINYAQRQMRTKALEVKL